MKIELGNKKNPTTTNLLSGETKEQIPSWSMQQKKQLHPPKPSTYPDSPGGVAYPRYSRNGRSDCLPHRLFCKG